ncbi:cytohesin-4 isoform X2 [Sapajus apella]|uniref:Cytohesin-4 isoform X2 n=1 Tax=Sapajus apella TaxID=9515 RepID=A0A6J3GYR5_SAPAP|nr:cytohesin-4 isoform X2 [Sapajus apella]
MDLCHHEPTELSSGEAEELQRIKWHRKQLLEDIQKLKDEIADVFAQIDCFESAEESRMAQKEKELCIGRKKFNMEPAKGIRYFIEHKLLTPDIQDIARFLYKGEGLNKTAIGTYLGERDPVNLQVLQAFVDCHEFANLNLVQALRQFLWSFRLPGEAQKIDRMMEAFATRYCLCNPDVFQSTDTCYVLSFSIIMLNTSLHNPNVRDKPPFERFVSMNRGINNGSDLPEDQLRNLFDSIKSEPFSIPEDDGNDLTHTFFNPDREGWLLKLGGRVKTWKRRWFILTDNCLYYFEFTTVSRVPWALPAPASPRTTPFPTPTEQTNNTALDRLRSFGSHPCPFYRWEKLRYKGERPGQGCRQSPGSKLSLLTSGQSSSHAAPTFHPPGWTVLEDEHALLWVWGTPHVYAQTWASRSAS